ncbi:homeobox protein vent1-like [Struthio camelus]|uniref:homeobox protein vent1-like n=1 Tax=Struthio camelus TaxID=8801 RepID=UPI003603C17E
MSRAEPPSPEPKPCGLRPHICCAPPPLAPTSLGSAPLLPRAEPRRGAARPGQPAGGGGPREPPAPSEPAPDSGWLSADESSGYESESAERGAAAEGPRGRQRRARTAFSAAQLGGLEETFRRRRYLGAAERRQLAAALHLSETQIKTWFQNRRMKLKRQVQEHQHRRPPAAPLCSCAPGAPLRAGRCPPGPRRGLLPLLPGPALPLGLHFPACDAPQSTYRFMANELPFYHQNFLPHPSFHAVIQNRMDKHYHPVYALS